VHRLHECKSDGEKVDTSLILEARCGTVNLRTDVYDALTYMFSFIFVVDGEIPVIRSGCCAF
jgi:hypothetical protein